MNRSALSLVCFLLAVAIARAEDNLANPGQYVSLFNGTDLSGWKCDQRFWRVEDGVIVGETTEENKAPHNTFLIRRDEQYRDFELRFLYQVKGFNSGIQYRSVEQKDYVVNGRVVAMAWDKDPDNRRKSGILAFQLHSGPPMQIKIKDIKVRKL